MESYQVIKFGNDCVQILMMIISLFFKFEYENTNKIQ